MCQQAPRSCCLILQNTDDCRSVTGQTSFFPRLCFKLGLQFEPFDPGCLLWVKKKNPKIPQLKHNKAEQWFSNNSMHETGLWRLLFIQDGRKSMKKGRLIHEALSLLNKKYIIWKHEILVLYDANNLSCAVYRTLHIFWENNVTLSTLSCWRCHWNDKDDVSVRGAVKVDSYSVRALEAVLTWSDFVCRSVDEHVQRPHHTGNCDDMEGDGTHDLPSLAGRHL